jgi:hypothetical protein
VVADIGRLSEDQRTALTLAELAGLSHGEIARVIGCERGKVKALVHQARANLLERRRARDTPCAAVQEQLLILSRGSLRRAWIQLHLRACPACRSFRDHAREQRQLLALTVPVVGAGLRESVLAAARSGAAPAGTGSVAAGAGGATGSMSSAAGTLGAASAGAPAASGGALLSLGSGAAAKVAVGLALPAGRPAPEWRPWAGTVPHRRPIRRGARATPPRAASLIRPRTVRARTRPRRPGAKRRAPRRPGPRVAGGRRPRPRPRRRPTARRRPPSAGPPPSAAKHRRACGSPGGRVPSETAARRVTGAPPGSGAGPPPPADGRPRARAARTPSTP